MPELPDVESFRRDLETHDLRRRIAAARASAPRMVEDVSARELERRLAGRRFAGTGRHGKYLFAHLDDGAVLVLHFGMTGCLAHAQARRFPSGTRLALEYADGRGLAYVCRRKLGRIGLAEDQAGFVDARGLGPDALALDLRRFRKLAAARRGGAKAWLMDQGAIAGIGNVYSDEILYQARVHPLRGVETLGPDEVRAVHRGLRKVLHKAIAVGADPQRMPRNFLLPHRHRNGRCPSCDRRVASIKAAGRTAWYCPSCQSSPVR